MLERHEAPRVWGVGKVILQHKRGEPSCPVNFHKLLARHLEEYCLANGIAN